MFVFRQAALYRMYMFEFFHWLLQQKTAFHALDQFKFWNKYDKVSNYGLIMLEKEYKESECFVQYSS